MGREQRDLGEDWSGATKGCIGVAVRLSSASLPLTLLSGVAFFFVWAGRGRGGGRWRKPLEPPLFSWWKDS